MNECFPDDLKSLLSHEARIAVPDSDEEVIGR